MSSVVIYREGGGAHLGVIHLSTWSDEAEAAAFRSGCTADGTPTSDIVEVDDVHPDFSYGEVEEWLNERLTRFPRGAHSDELQDLADAATKLELFDLDCDSSEPDVDRGIDGDCSVAAAVQSRAGVTSGPQIEHVETVPAVGPQPESLGL